MHWAASKCHYGYRLPHCIIPPSTGLSLQSCVNLLRGNEMREDLFTAETRRTRRLLRAEKWVSGGTGYQPVGWVHLHRHGLVAHATVGSTVFVAQASSTPCINASNKRPKGSS